MVPDFFLLNWKQWFELSRAWGHCVSVCGPKMPCLHVDGQLRLVLPHVPALQVRLMLHAGVVCSAVLGMFAVLGITKHVLCMLPPCLPPPLQELDVSHSP
jgi:hypothetical protein